MPAKTLRLVLGDQLNETHSWFDQPDPQVTYVMMEVRTETDYVRHHIQKVCAFFLAMRAFRDRLRELGHEVIYLALDDPENHQSFPDNLRHLIASGGFQRFQYQLPDEYRLDQVLKEFAESLEIEVGVVDTEHFFTQREHLERFFRGKKQYLMEYFYRDLRKREGILMEGGEPATGRWNYDAENRNKFKGDEPIPVPPDISQDVKALETMLEKAGVATMGVTRQGRIHWPVTREAALRLMEHFVEHLLPFFGKYQDALTTADPFLFHSRLSFAMNVKLLSPREVVEAAVKMWEKDPERYDIAQVEGFVRQILGWREYMRGLYWAKMPDYARLNYFNHQAKLPEWFWTGETKMACQRHAIRQSLQHAYAHHIQRLMVTGNFALLLGVHPDEVDQWYLGVYIDALEWVEITNTRGMSQYADGGIVGSKPYVSSANYMHKMSDYCSGCHYDHKEKTGPRACPFNSLYWDFYQRHRDLLEKNPRIGMAYRTWDKMDPDQRAAILEKAQELKTKADQL